MRMCKHYSMNAIPEQLNQTRSPTQDMNSRLTIIALSLFFLLPVARAEDARPTIHMYEGRITGLFCNACAAKVKSSLGRIEGVTSVRITNTQELGVQKVHVQSTSDKLTKEKAIQALGEDAGTFTLLTLERTK